GSEIARVEGLPDNGAKDIVVALSVFQDSAKLRFEDEQALILDALIIFLHGIADGPDEALAAAESALHTILHPFLVYLLEEVLNVFPRCAFAALAGAADGDDVQIEVMSVGLDAEIGGAADTVAKSDEGLEEDGDGIGFAVGRNDIHEFPGQPVISSVVNLRSVVGLLTGQAT